MVKSLKLYIQNMVSLRCKLLVKFELDKLKIQYTHIDLGEVDLLQPISQDKICELKQVLHQNGLEIMDDKNAILLEKIKTAVVEMIHYSDELPKVNFSNYLSEKLQVSYHQLSELFSRSKGMTIEHFVILHKVERIKELIIYDELSLSEIAFNMHYSSIGHLSNQFKKVTGFTPSFFKKMKDKVRNNLENL